MSTAVFSRVAVSFYIPTSGAQGFVFPHPHQHVCAEPSSAASLGALARSSIRSGAARTQTLASPDMSSCLSDVPAFFSLVTCGCAVLEAFPWLLHLNGMLPPSPLETPSPSAFRSCRSLISQEALFTTCCPLPHSCFCSIVLFVSRHLA